AGDRHVGIELERTPDDLGRELRAEQFEASLHPPFADVTPRADEVGVDFDFQWVHEMDRGIMEIESGCPGPCRFVRDVFPAPADWLPIPCGPHRCHLEIPAKRVREPRHSLLPWRYLLQCVAGEQMLRRPGGPPGPAPCEAPSDRE